MRLANTLLPLLILIAAAIPAELAAETPAASEENLQLVLLPSDTWLYAAPDAKAHRFQIRKRVPSMKRTYKRGPFPIYATARPRRVFLFRLVEALPAGKGWAHLRPLAGAQRVPNRCDFLSPGSELNIDLYVKSEVLLTTLKEEFRAGFEDGTELGLKPGVVIRPTKKKGRYIAETPTLQVNLQLPPDSTSQTFSPVPGFDFGKAPAWAKGPVKLKLSGDIKATLFGVEIGLQAKPVRRGHGRWLIADTGSCARVIGEGRYRPLNREPRSTLGGILGMLPADALVVPKGKPVFWSDGNKAGQTASRLIFEPKQEQRTTLKDRRCFKREYFANKSMVLCFASELFAEDGKKETP